MTRLTASALSIPSAKSCLWLAQRRGEPLRSGERAVYVIASSWYSARKRAAIAFGLDPTLVTVERKP